MTEDVNHFLLQCIDFQEHWEVFVTPLLGKSMILSVVNLLQNECFYDLIWVVCSKNKKRFIGCMWHFSLSNRTTLIVYSDSPE